jgi:hypothetical protein
MSPVQKKKKENCRHPLAIKCYEPGQGIYTVPLLNGEKKKGRKRRWYNDMNTFNFLAFGMHAERLRG